MLAKLTRMEARLFLREPISLFFALIFPALFLYGLANLFPGFTDPATELGGARFVDVYAPVAIAFGTAMLGLSTLPPTLATYRQFGILRRLRTTPLHPARLLGAQMIVQGSVAVVSAVAVVIVAAVAFDVPFPQSPLWFLLSFLLTAVSMFATGLLIGSVTRTNQAAISIGMAAFFPMLFFAGLWIPRAIMSDTLQTIADFTPLGAGTEAMSNAWFGSAPTALQLGVLLVYSVIVGVVTVRVFRWE
jgi:ABC-2 type transport system permease protein